MATIPNLPSTTYKLDQLFTTTWFEMSAKATDNILDSNVVSAALRAKGCFKSQNGGRHISRTLRYGTDSAIMIQKGDTLPTGETELETVALWNWKYLHGQVSRSAQDDQQNSGPAARKNLVQTRLEAMRDAMAAKIESQFVAIPDASYNYAVNGILRAPRDMYSIFNFHPGSATYGMAATYFNTTTGYYTYGGIDTGTTNTWWQAKYATEVAPILMNLETQWRKMFNDCSQGTSDTPDLLVTNQTHFEAYDEIASSKVQQVMPTGAGSRLVELGYDVRRYKGADVIWTSSSTWPTWGTAFLNTKWIDVIYDPAMWMADSGWLQQPNQLERVMRVVSAITGPICYQLRRQGWLGKAA